MRLLWSLSNIEITDRNIKSFERVARKYNVDFSLKKDVSETPPQGIVFFKAKDTDALTAAFNEYSKVILKKKTLKPSMSERLNKFKELAESIVSPVKNREKGEREL
jgi:L-lactate utilization protein LutC